jgi:RimJ/RimL family protein N-acetyltransferase
MKGARFLRDLLDEDLPVFFEQQCDVEANYMAAFTAKEPTNRITFLAHWQRIRADTTVTIKVIVYDGQVAGHVMSYREDDRCEVTYWLGKSFWGQGIARQSLAEFLAHTNQARPIYARTAKDNIASARVLENNGFSVISESKGFANARGEEIAELLWELP